MGYYNRKPTRLKDYDYSQPGMYFITMCTKERKPLLSKILVGDGALDVPYSKMSVCGEIVDKNIKQMANFYEYISVDKYVIMPNHVHMLIRIDENDLNKGTSRTPSPTNSMVAQFISTLKRFANKEFGENLWQRTYHDHIIRGEADYKKIWNYIDTNIIRWEKDIFYVKDDEKR